MGLVPVALALGGAAVVAAALAAVYSKSAKNPNIVAKIKADEKEIKSKRVDETRLEQAKKDLAALQTLVTD